MPSFFVVFFLLLLCLPSPGKGNETSSPPVVPPSSCTIRPARQEITLNGFTRARAELAMTAEVSGRLLSVHGDTGDFIESDGIFATVDPTLIEFELASNRIRIKELKRTIVFDSDQVKRYRQLLTSKSSSRARLDELLLQLDRSRLQLEQLQVEGQRLEEMLERHTVKAPPGWRIMERTAEPGQWVAAGTVLGRAGDYQSLVIPLAVTQEELTGLREQKTVPVLIGNRKIKVSGTLYRVSPAFDPVSRKFRIEILLSPDACSSLPLRQGGLQAAVPVTVPDPMRGFLVPAEAVSRRYEEHWLTRSDGEQVRVIVLGSLTDRESGKQLLHITSPSIRAGEHCLLPASP
jgi:RND family efflux transporter MFP subunit